MKYSAEIVIAAPRDRVVRLFDDPARMKEWMDGLVGVEWLEGTPGDVGSRARLAFQWGKRRMEMIKTVTVRDLPRELSGSCEATGVWNGMRNVFTEESPGTTRWRTDQEFRFTGLMKLMGFLFPGMFRLQTRRYLEAFKAFVERSADGQ